LVLHELPVHDHPVGLLRQQQGVAELHLRAGLPPDDHVHVRLVQAQDLVRIGHQTAADDPLVGLVDRHR